MDTFHFIAKDMEENCPLPRTCEETMHYAHQNDEHTQAPGHSWMPSRLVQNVKRQACTFAPLFFQSLFNDNR